MEFDKEKIDEMVLALLYLTSFEEPKGFYRAWKSHDWEVLSRLHEKGFISDPKSKAKSVTLSEEGFELSKKLFVKYFQVT
ncbi:MAG: DUF6429 family protein [Candidatus Marinimicrobia bacterium]|nr:hypothetical protein [bacterium]MCG2715803.1 DUF6429 family protein [Candidatus Neomarinimicrobiota bacterium]